MSGEHYRYPSLRITGLGNFAIEYLAAQATAADNEPHYSSVAEDVWRGRKQAQTVLKALLCRPHRRAPREVLQEAIWPHGKGDSAETAFNAIISVLRHVLSLPISQKPLLTITRVDEQTIYQLAPQTFIWMDADEAETLLIQAEQARRDGEDPLPLLEQAYHFFGKGPFLAEDDGAWVQQRKWHMDEAAHRCTHWLVDLYEERDLLRQATTVLSALFESDPTDEDMLSRLMRLLVTQERRQEALRCYQRAERALQEEDLEPTPAIKKLAERIRNEAIEIKGKERFGENQHIPLQTIPLAITQGIIGTVQESESLDMDRLRRQLLQQGIGITGIAVFAPIYKALNFAEEMISRPIEEFLLQCSTNIAACWRLMKGYEIDVVQSLLSLYLPQLEILLQRPSKYQKTIAGLAAQGYMLAGLVMVLRQNYSLAELNCKYAVQYSRLAEDRNLEVAALKHLATKYLDMNHPIKTLDTYREASNHINQISPLLRSRTYLGLAIAHAKCEQKQEALTYLGLAQDTFPDTPENDPGFLYADCGLSSLYHYEGLIHLTFNEPKEAWDSFANVNKQKPKILIPERTIIELINCQAEAAVAQKNLELACIHVQEAIIGALKLNSEKRYHDTYSIYKQMCLIWPHEKQVIAMADQFHR